MQNEKYGKDWIIIRKRILKRDSNLCRKCGKPAKEIHHLIPYSISHSNHDTNLITLCKRHHRIADENFIKLGVTHYVKTFMYKNIMMRR
jgi:5-methylcytosine-specific restriction endonuclease McrA